LHSRLLAIRLHRLVRAGLHYVRLLTVRLHRLIRAGLHHVSLLTILLHWLEHAGLHHVRLLTVLLQRLVHARLHHVRLLTVLLQRLVHAGLHHVRLLTVLLHRLIHVGLHHVRLLTILLTELLAILHLALVHSSHLSLHSRLNLNYLHVSSHLIRNLIGHHLNSTSYIKRSEVNAANNSIKMSDFNPLLPATRQTHPLNWEFNMPDQRLSWAFFISDLESKLLV